jgi:hypothetical protein
MEDFQSVTDSSPASLIHRPSAAIARSQFPTGLIRPSCLSYPFNWHRLAFDLFKLSLPAGVRAVRKVSAEPSLDGGVVGMGPEHLGAVTH